jgi:hypothetical protein
LAVVFREIGASQALVWLDGGPAEAADIELDVALGETFMDNEAAIFQAPSLHVNHAEVTHER